MPSSCDNLGAAAWFNREVDAGITHRLAVPDGDHWQDFFEDAEIVNDARMFYKLNEDRTALFILTYY
jgi:hypothetical protein